MVQEQQVPRRSFPHAPLVVHVAVDQAARGLVFSLLALLVAASQGM